MSDSRDTLSPDSGVASVDAKLVTYEEAISLSAHKGESIIAKELREQKEREEELRKRWNDMGVNSPYDPRQVPDTPYNQPEPQQPKPIPGHHHQQKVLSNGGTHGGFSNGSAKSPAGLYQQGIRSYMTAPATTNTVRRGSVESDHSHASSGDAKQTLYRDEEDGSHGYTYQPRDETPIEREIRLVKEREEELRMQKGLSPRSRDHEREPVYEVKDDLPRRPQNLGGNVKDRAPLKHFTTGRLHYEMEKEKQRELTMQKEGQIKTISQERAEIKKYTDVIDKDNLNAPAPSPMKTPTSPHVAKPAAYMRSPSMPIYNYQTPFGKSDATSPSVNRQLSSPPPSAHPSSPPAPIQNGAAAVTMVPRPAEQQKGAAEVARKPVAVNAGSGGVVSKSANSAELRIEAELREMREREDELRRQRHGGDDDGGIIEESDVYRATLSGGHTDDTIQTDNTREGAPSPTHNESSLRSSYPSSFPGDVVERKGRKKSALAQQWEQKFAK